MLEAGDDSQVIQESCHTGSITQLTAQRKTLLVEFAGCRIIALPGRNSSRTFEGVGACLLAQPEIPDAICKLETLLVIRSGLLVISLQAIDLADVCQHMADARIIIQLLIAFPSVQQPGLCFTILPLFSQEPSQSPLCLGMTTYIVKTTRQGFRLSIHLLCFIPITDEFKHLREF